MTTSCTCTRNLLVAGVLGDGLCALGDGVFGQFSREDEADRSLDLAAGQCLRLGVADELARLGGDTVEDVVHEGVHDGHGLLGDTGVGVHLLQHLVDVDGEGLGALLLAGLSGLLLGGFLGHCERAEICWLVQLVECCVWCGQCTAWGTCIYI